MKYLNIEVIANDPSYYEWDRRYDLWMQEFATIQDKFPKRFLKEFGKNHFHDNIIDAISLNRIVTKKGASKYHLNMKLLDHDDKRFVHDLDFFDVRKFKPDLLFDGGTGVCDWLYCEILPAGEGRFSLEINLFGNDSSIYFDFSKMRYKKIRIDKNESK